MQRLFRDKPLGAEMNRRLTKLKDDIARLACSQIRNKAEDEIDKMASSYAAETCFDRLPVIDEMNIEKKYIESINQLRWSVPFKGDKDFFVYSPSGAQISLAIAGIEDRYLDLNVSQTPGVPIEQSEEDTLGTLEAVKRGLARLHQDTLEQFSYDLIRATAYNALRQRRDYCKQLIPDGYKIV